MKCDHLWFYDESYSQLQRDFGNMMHGDQNLIKVSCKISWWKSGHGKFTPVIARMEVHAECICHPSNSVIIDDNSQNVDDDFDSSENVDDSSDDIDTELGPLLSLFSTSSGTISSAFKQKWL